MTDTVASLIAKLMRDQPRNPTVIALDEAIKSVVSTPVASTAKAGRVVSTDCETCAQRRANKARSMKNWRAKANIQSRAKISVQTDSRA